VTFTRQGDGVIYLDGVQINVTPLNSMGATQTTFGYPTNIFQDGTGNYTDDAVLSNWDDASMCDLGIWRRAITADEVTTIYTQGLQGISALDSPGGAPVPRAGLVPPHVLADLAAALPSSTGPVTGTPAAAPPVRVPEVGTGSAHTNTVADQGTPDAGAFGVWNSSLIVTGRMGENRHIHAPSQASPSGLGQVLMTRAADTVFADGL
jgi:hypothetical protein